MEFGWRPMTDSSGRGVKSRVLFEVNPSTVLTVSYPQSSEACADPENIPDEVEGTVVTPPTTPDQVDGVDVLPFTGVHGGALAAVAFAALALGGLMLLSARRDEAEDELNPTVSR